MKYSNEKTIDIIRGKALAGGASKDDIMTLLAHIAALEDFLDEHDNDDLFGTEGWRHHF